MNSTFLISQRFFPTCVLSSSARATAKMSLTTPSAGAASTTRYVMPSSGISTSSAFDALRYWRVSTVLAERSFVIRTCEVFFWNWRKKNEIIGLNLNTFWVTLKLLGSSSQSAFLIWICCSGMCKLKQVGNMMDESLFWIFLLPTYKNIIKERLCKWNKN